MQWQKNGGYASVWFIMPCLVSKSTDKVGGSITNWLLGNKEDPDEGMRMNQKPGMNQMKKSLHLRNQRLARESVQRKPLRKKFKKRDQMMEIMMMTSCLMYLCKSTKEDDEWMSMEN